MYGGRGSAEGGGEGRRGAAGREGGGAALVGGIQGAAACRCGCYQGVYLLWVLLLLLLLCEEPACWCESEGSLFSRMEAVADGACPVGGVYSGAALLQHRAIAIA